MSRTLPLFLLLSSPLFAAIVPGPEIPLTVPVIGEAAFDQSNARIASGGDGFLAVWEEQHPSGADVHAARITADGTRVDDSPLVIAASKVHETQPDVEAGAGRYLVTWTTAGRVAYRFVSGDGTISEPVVLGDGIRPRVAFDGNVFLVVWLDASFHVRGATIDGRGTVQPAAIDARWVDPPEVVAAGGTFHVVTSGNGEIVTRTPGGARRVLAQSWERMWASAHDGELIVAWQAGDEVRFVRGGGAVQSMPATPPVQALIGDRLVLNDGSHVYVRRLDGTLLHTIATPRPLVVTDGAAEMLVTHADAVEDAEAHLLALDSRTFTPLAVSAALQQRPDIAAAGDVALAVWQEAGIRAALVHADGAVTPLGLVSGDESAQWPRVASNGDGWLVVWRDNGTGIGNGTVHGRRVARDGSSAGEPFVIARYVLGVEGGVVWDGAAYVFAFRRGTATRLGLSAAVVAARVHDDGRIDETVLAESGPNHDVAIAAGGDGVLAVWRERGPSDRLRAALLSRGGTITPVMLQEHGEAAAAPAAAWNGRLFAVAGAYAHGRVEWFLVSENGVVSFTPGTAAVPLTPVLPLHLSAIGERFLLLASGHAAVLDPRGFVGEPPAPVVPDTNVRADGRLLIYDRAADPARPHATRVFVRTVDVAANPPRRRAVR